jgi:hypothetical protein
MIFNYIIHSSHFTSIKFVSFVSFNLIKGHIINNYEFILNKSDFFYKLYIRKCIELLKLVFTKYLHIFIIVKNNKIYNFLKRKIYIIISIFNHLNWFNTFIFEHSLTCIFISCFNINLCKNIIKMILKLNLSIIMLGKYYLFES